MSAAEVDILVEAGTSRELAQLVVAAYTMATTLAVIQQQQQQPAADPVVAEPAPVVEGDEDE